MASALDVILHVTETFEALGVPYVIVGSFASSIRRRARSTADVDIVADIEPERIEHVVQSFASDFYIDEKAVRRAVATGRSFNAIHLESMFKVDVFIAPPSGHRRQQLEHRQREVILTEPERSVYIATAEDTVLAKLQWFARGGRVSDRQWSDILGVLQVQGTDMDWEYLRRNARELGVEDLLERASSEAERATRDEEIS
jgi:hypothetical protein